MSKSSSSSLKGPGLWALFAFSLPSIFSSLLEPLAGVVDTALVGRLDTQWLAALAIGTTILSTFTWMFNFLLHSSTHAVSRVLAESEVSSGNHSKVAQSILMSLYMAFGVGLLAALFLFFSRHFLYSMAGAASESGHFVQLIEEYFIIRVFGHPVVLLFGTALSIIRGLGAVRASFFFVATSTLLNILMSWSALYVFDLGLRGVAFATVLSYFVGFVLCLLFIILSRRELRSDLFRLIPAPLEEWLRFGRNSLNLFGRSAGLSLSLFLAMRVASEFGIIELAAHQIMLQVWLFASFFTDGVAISGNILGAKYWAKKQFELLEELVKNLLLMGGSIGLAFCFAYLLFSSFIQGLFTTDLSVINVLSTIWWALAISQLSNALAFTLDGILFGLERFNFLRRHMLIGVGAVFLPFALWAWQQESLLLLWLGLIILNLYRMISGLYAVKDLWPRYK